MAGDDEVDLLVCDGCGRSFTTVDGPGMVAALKGPCPDCGGRFEPRGRLPLNGGLPRDDPAPDDLAAAE